MLVPQGWKLEMTPDGQYELTRPGETGAAHISVYSRPDSPIGDTEAYDLVAGFLTTISAEGEVMIHVLPEGPDHHRAVARCHNGRFHWVVSLALWRQHFALCSCTAGEGSPILTEAETMFATMRRPDGS